MDWLRNFQQSIDYIEEHITDSLAVSEIARTMNISEFYYQKIFSIICGFTVGEYIRSRRLALAGSELVTTDNKIIDIAFKYGYDSPEGFARAFTRFHNATPTAVRKGAPFKSFAKLSVSISVKGGISMNCKIVKKDAFKVLGRTETHSIDNSQNKHTIPDFWDRAKNDGTIKTLLEKAPDAKYIFGICYGNSSKDGNTFDYSIAALRDESCDIPEGLSVSEIPARTWAVFECIGSMPDAIQSMWHKICTEFFPSSSYQPTYELDIEVYPGGNMTDQNYRSEIWVPVEKK